MAAQPGAPPVPQLLHGVPGGRSHAGSSHQEGPPGPPEDGGQLPPVSQAGTWVHLPTGVFTNPGALSPGTEVLPSLFVPVQGGNRSPFGESLIFASPAIGEFSSLTCIPEDTVISP